MNKNSAYVIPLVLILSACASDEVIVDTKGVNEQRYQQDLAECEVYSQQVNTGKTIAKRGTRGAVIGVPLAQLLATVVQQQKALA